jgi:hypothetical protein
MPAGVSEERKVLHMQRRRTKARTLRAVFAAALAVLTLAGVVLAGLAASSAGAATVPKTPPTTLGIWTSAEDAGSYSSVAGQHPDIANYYLAWGQQWPAQFISQAEAAGATPLIEIEAWHAGPNWNQTPSLTSIAASDDSADADCTLDGSTYDTSCATWLADIGKAIAQLAKPVIITINHEPNVAGQYPWAAGDTGSCGSVSCTPAQWIAAWDAVQDAVNGNGASAYAEWMWAPNADTGGSSQNFTAWWPGASRVDMVGLDGYPQSGDGWGLCSFQELFGQSFTEMRTLTSLPVFISETDLAALSTSQSCNGGAYETITGFIDDLFAAGGDGVLQFQDGTTALTSAQWAELDTALATHPAPAATTASAPAPAATTASTPAPAPTPTSTATATGSGNCAATTAWAGGQVPWAEKEPGQLPAWHARWSRNAGGAQ